MAAVYKVRLWDIIWALFVLSRPLLPPVNTMSNTANGSSQTGIKIIIVGAGFGGLACAIESKRKGHEVILLERFKELKVLGKFLVSSSDAASLRLRPTGDVSK